mgnify:CR=1 FL=1
MNRLVNGNVTSIEAMTDVVLNSTKQTKKTEAYDGPSFQEIFNTKASIDSVISKSNIGQVKFSKHANERLEQRNITLSDEQLGRLKEGTQKAISKGIKESLVLVDNLAFIVNTSNRTVVTAMDSQSNEENVYTNIDGAVVI